MINLDEYIESSELNKAINRILNERIAENDKSENLAVAIFKAGDSLYQYILSITHPEYCKREILERCHLMLEEEKKKAFNYDYSNSENYPNLNHSYEHLVVCIAIAYLRVNYRQNLTEWQKIFINDLPTIDYGVLYDYRYLSHDLSLFNQMVDKFLHPGCGEIINYGKDQLIAKVMEQAKYIAELEAKMDASEGSSEDATNEEEEEIKDEGFENDLKSLKHTPRDLILFMQEFGVNLTDNNYFERGKTASVIDKILGKEGKTNANTQKELRILSEDQTENDYIIFSKSEIKLRNLDNRKILIKRLIEYITKER